MEPHFYKHHLSPNLEHLLKAMAEDKLSMKIEYNRKNADETAMFLYDIENIFLVGKHPETP